MISPEGIPNCGSCNHYSKGFCNVNPIYLGRASECPHFNRVSTKEEINETVRELTSNSLSYFSLITGLIY